MEIVKHTVLLIDLLFSTISIATDTPDWVTNNGISAAFPEHEFFTGLGIGEDDSKADRMGIAERNTRNALSSQFIVKIHSELVSKVVESAGKYYSDFRNTVSSQTQLNLLGVDISRWDDIKNDRTYALAVMNVNAAIRNYSNRFDDSSKEINALIQSAEKAAQSNNVREAIKQYRKTFPLFIELGETGTILSLLQGRSAFSSTDNTASAFSMTTADIDSKINELLTVNINSLQSAAVSLAEQLHSQLETNISVGAFPLIYRDTDFSSEFSLYFLPILEKELIPYYQIISRDVSGSHARHAENILTGTYWNENGTVHIQVFITSLNNGSKRAAASIKLPKAVIESEGVELLPQNFQQAMEDSRVFMKQDVIPGSLSLDVWTSKGKNNLLFKENQKTEIFVRVTRPCYLQMIYHMANGVRLLLYNNLYIDISKVNQVYTMPDTFYFAPPLGVERLQIFSSTEKFGKVQTRSATFDGELYKDVFDEDFKDYTVAMRGMKKKKTEKQIAEKIITITTIP